jgi:hypothetical protein
MEENTQDTQQAEVHDPFTTSAVDVFDSQVEQRFGAQPNEGSEVSNSTVKDAFTTQTDKQEAQTPQEGQSQQPQEIPEQGQPLDAKNDERRYQYWQSQAAKRENELAELKQQVENNQQTQAPGEQAKPVEEFPPPPAMPSKPSGFSYEEAMSDRQSESSRYLEEKESWDTDIRQYDTLRHQYDLAVMQEKLDKQNDYIVDQESQREAQVQQGRQVQQISEHVQGHYGFNPEDTKEFIRTMSDPSSISMDNLVQLFRMNKAGGQQPAVNAGPSQEFQQIKNAQQIPSPMGVMPSQSPQGTRNDADTIMDELINSHKSKNPWT